MIHTTKLRPSRRRVMSGVLALGAVLSFPLGAQTGPQPSLRIQEQPAAGAPAGETAQNGDQVPASASAANGRAVPPEVMAALGPRAVLQGEKRFRWFTFTVYDIRLWVPGQASAQTLFDRPFVLELQYARTLYGKKIAERSLDEMKGLSSFSEAQAKDWLAFMERAFPDVNEGDRLSGVWNPDGKVTFLFNDKETASINDARFGELFFGIWLAPGTSEPAMRLALLGLEK